MPKLARPLLALLASAAAPAVAQQPSPPADQSPIVVTGDKVNDDAIRTFVKDLTRVRSDGQLSRFEHSVCPIALGLTPQQRETVENRVRLVAKEVGIAVGKPKCSANIVLIVASDKHAVMEELRRHYIYIYGDVTGDRIRDLIRSPNPVAAWQIDGPPVADGRDVPTDFGSGLYVNRTTARSSRITAAAYPQFAAAVVVVSRDALAGLTTTQLADYVAIRALTGADPARLGKSGPTTILRAIDAPEGAEVPITMTEWDLAFLRGYYDARRNLTAAAQRSSIAKGMTEAPKQEK
jgi:hypothetical protein